MTVLAHTSLPEGADPAYSYGKLRFGVHDPLVAQLPEIADRAGIPATFITGERYALTDFEKDYLVGFRRTAHTGALGLIYTGSHDPSVLDRSRSVVGALTRNFIEARFVLREELITMLFGNRAGPQEPLVAVPDFHYADLPNSAAHSLRSWLTGRIGRGRQTVLGFGSKSDMDATFKPGLADAIKHFEVFHGAQTPKTN